VNRRELDAFVERHGLSRAAVEAALELTRSRPTAEETQRFVVRLLWLAGLLSVSLGVVFFIAANWDAITVRGRFALVEVALAAAVAVALWRPPPDRIGRGATLVAFILTGTLLALFGQTYQTGADLYELFLTWTMLGVPFLVAARWSAVSAAWLLVLNVALLLYCGWRPESGWLWVLFAGWGIHLSLLLLGAALPNVLAWLASERLAGTPSAELAPEWVGRFALACALGFATWSGVYAILDFEYRADASASRATSLAIIVAMLVAVGAYALAKRRDVFPLAAVAASAIALSTAAFAKILPRLDDAGALLLLAAWLVVTSTVSGRELMKIVRAWRPTGAES
jgi:uncharacterized membrane protein